MACQGRNIADLFRNPPAARSLLPGGKMATPHAEEEYSEGLGT